MSLAVHQDVQCSSVTCLTIMNGGFATNIVLGLYDHAKQNDNEFSSHVNGNGGSCMAIYIRVAIEMP